MKNLKFKKGQNSLIVNVLLILIVIVAITLVGAWIFNLIGQKLKMDENKMTLKMDSELVLYSDMTERAYIKVIRGSEDVNLTAIKFTFTVNGDSVSYINDNVPGILASKTYSFIFPVENKPSLVKITPIILLGSSKVELDSSEQLDLKVTNVAINVLDLDRCSFLLNQDKDFPPSPAEPGCNSRVMPQY